MTVPDIEPVTDAALPEFCRFLNENLNKRISPAVWVQAFCQDWGVEKPNNGLLIRDEGRIVGGIGAIYSEQDINGQPERFCNITSWCVLDRYRAQSMRLAMAVVGQKGFHFTDLTPTEVVARSLSFLKFKALDGARTVVFNLPGPSRGARVLSKPEAIDEALGPAAGKIYRDHCHLPWLRHVAVGRDGRYVHVIYKRAVLRHLPSAEIIWVSDGELFVRNLRAYSAYVLLRHGMLTTRIETRLLPAVPPFSVQRTGYRPRMFLSDSLTEKDIGNLYSELVALDL